MSQGTFKKGHRVCKMMKNEVKGLHLSESFYEFEIIETPLIFHQNSMQKLAAKKLRKSMIYYVSRSVKSCKCTIQSLRNKVSALTGNSSTNHEKSNINHNPKPIKNEMKNEMKFSLGGTWQQMEPKRNKHVDSKGETSGSGIYVEIGATCSRWTIHAM